MLTRRIAALTLVLCLAGCANNVEPAAAPNPSASDVLDLPLPSTVPSADRTGKPTGGATTTISGTVGAGVEPNCLLLQDSSGSHLLIFKDAAMRADVSVGAKVSLTGHPEPGMMSTCQQGVPFIVTAVQPG